MYSAYGVQPARERVRALDVSVRRFARLLGLEENHLRSSLLGQIRPSHEVRDALTRFFDVPITDLFTPDAIEKPYRIQRTGVVTSELP